MSLKDPLDEFLKSNGILDVTFSGTISLKQADHIRHTLLWRQDPGKSLSDWKIILESVVMDKQNDTLITKDKSITKIAPLTTTFHVHQCILAGGSTYFQSLFNKRKGIQTCEHETQGSIIKLHPLAIQSFPVFLDHVYNIPLGKLGFERSNAVAVRHLAMYFGVDALLKDISELILLDIRNKEFREAYSANAAIFKDEKLLH